MVMSVMREKTKVVLFVALAAFTGLIFFDWGMQKGNGGRGPSQGGVIGEVNGQEISSDSYRRTRQSIVANFEARTGRSPEYADYDAIEDETWLTLVRDTLLQTEIERRGIRISNPEILEVLRTNPPQAIRSDPTFLDENGQFDPVRYSQALANPSFNWLPVENYLRAILPGEKLQNFVGMNARVTEGEIREAFLARNEKARARFVSSTAARMELEEDAISEAAVREYFDTHPEEFVAGEQAVLEIVSVPKTPSLDDSLTTREDLANVRDQIIAGADFENTATTWSDDGSASRGGDLGFVRRGDMVSEFETVAFATPVGEVSEVFESPFGLHILKVDEIGSEGDEETRRVRHILMRIESSNTTLREAGRRMDGFIEALEAGDDFAAAAAELGLEVTRTEPFEQNGVITGLGLLRGASRFAFSRRPGDVTWDPIEDDRSLYAFRLADRLEPGATPLEDVRAQIETIVGEEIRRTRARAALASAISAGSGSLDGIATALDAAADTTGEFTRESFVPGVGRRNAFVATAFQLAAGQTSGIIETDRGYYVMEMVERAEADDSLFAEQRDSIYQQLLIRKRQALIGAWVEKLLREATVVDYRGGPGVDWTPDASLFQYSEA